MLKLAHVFSDNALYLHSSPLTVRGYCAPHASVTLTLAKEQDGALISEIGSSADERGNFYIDIITPEASFETYKITVSSQSERAEIKGILFGELWLASGQSNMELPNYMCAECEQMLDSLAGLPIRAYHIPNLSADADYSREPLEDFEGEWTGEGSRELWRTVSATATSFAKELYYYFVSLGKQIPVGFVNASRGAANIECWLPERETLEKSFAVSYLKKVDLLPTDENYNTLGANNYRQVGCYYNFKIHSTVGVRYRGILWYQGESNIGTHNSYGKYGELLELFRNSLKPRFAPDEAALFPLISSQLYPWAFNSCNMGYLNLAISSLTRKNPKAYSFVPVCDMRSCWSFPRDNHPIHPIHKYEHGKRYALVAENMLYGRGGRGSQKHPAILVSKSVQGNKIILKFKSVGSGIYIKGNEARGLYIRSEKSVYVRAYAEVIGKNKIAVSHPAIENPTHVSYAMASFEHYPNLYAGEFAIPPFSTEVNGRTGKPKIDIKVKNWLSLELDGELFILEGDRNSFPRAIYHPSENSEISYDSDYAIGARSLRIRGTANGFGAYVLSHKLREFDFENYTALRFSVLNTKGLEASVRLYYELDGVKEVAEQSVESIIHAQGEMAKEHAGKKLSISAPADTGAGEARFAVCEICAEKLSGEFNNWGEYSVDLCGVPKGKIAKMEFFFRISEENHLRTTVNVDKIYLVPKQ